MPRYNIELPSKDFFIQALPFSSIQPGISVERQVKAQVVVGRRARGQKTEPVFLQSVATTETESVEQALLLYLLRDAGNREFADRVIMSYERR